MPVTPAGEILAEQSPARSDPQGAARRKAARSSIGKVVPGYIASDLCSVVRNKGVIDMELAKELDGLYQIEAQYGVSLRRLEDYLQGVKAACQGRRRPARSVSACAAAGGDRPPLEDLRQRQASCAKILAETFGPMAKSKPELWEHRAYLMLVGSVYDRLADSQDGLSTKDLSALAKVLSEARRADVGRNEKRPGGATSEIAPKGVFPARFEDLVRQVYGANYHSRGKKPADAQGGDPV